MRLDGKIAIVTGAGSGFGAAMATRFALEGAAVICADLDGDKAAETARALGNGSSAFGCDVADAASVAALAEHARARYGRVDILVNNAAISQRPKRTAKSDLSEIERLFAVNVLSIQHMIVHVLPLMRERGGSVINMTSVTAIRPRPGMTWYNATKAAVISVTHSMAGEFAADRIRVNAIAPGVSRTPMFDAIFGAGERAEQAYGQLVDTFPLGRLSEPADIASAALYLASDEASFITGVVLPVDGGRLIG